MRIANVANRLVLVVSPGVGLDVAISSRGRFSADPQEVYSEWAAFCEWAESADADAGAAEPFRLEDLRAPAPRPRQIYAIGLNYRDHIIETNSTSSAMPLVFTKFVSSITGPYAEVALPAGNVDWEVELVVVVGSAGRYVRAAEAWSHVAGVTIGQDISERILQHSGEPPQFSLGKSYPGFAPMGPVLVTPDEIRDPDDLALGCSLNGESVQLARTSMMVAPVPKLIEYVSSTTPLLPGDVIFTGTPAGVGLGRTPPRYLAVGDELVSFIEGVGEMRTRFVANGTR